MPQDDLAEIKETLLQAMKTRADYNPTIYRKIYILSASIRQVSCLCDIIIDFMPIVDFLPNPR